jgi:succinate dehydrogenase hydrophobic anchor subunit
MNNIFLLYMDLFPPSVYAHIFNGLLLFIALIVIALNYSKLKKYVANPWSAVLLILLLSIAVGIHGISHLGLESVYGYNPLKLYFQ